MRASGKSFPRWLAGKRGADCPQALACPFHRSLLWTSGLVCDGGSSRET